MVAYRETGAGQTTRLKALLGALTTTNWPEVLQLVIVDPKAVDWRPCAGRPHLARPAGHGAARGRRYGGLAGRPGGRAPAAIDRAPCDRVA